MTKKKPKSKPKPETRKYPKVRNGFERIRMTTFVSGPSRTKQEFKDECDINQIVGQYHRTGVLTHVNRREPQYGYATGEDFAEAMRLVIDGETMFAELPSEVRKRFRNDPAEFLEFVQNPENAAEMVELGLSDTREAALKPPEQQTAPPAPEPEKPPPAASQAVSE